MRAKKVIVVGLDGATPELVWQWAKSGELPTLRRIMDEGVHGELRSTIPPLSPSAWSSFSTGKNPGKHGVFDHVRRRKGSYRLEPMNASLRQGRPIWKLLNVHGKTAGVVNLPGTYPPEAIDGYMISGMYTPSKQSTYTSPPSLSGELETAIGHYALFSDSDNQDDYGEVLTALLDSSKSRTKAIEFLMGKHPTDFTMIVFDETDRGQHKFWKFMDATHPLHNPAESVKYGNAILQIHREIDHSLKEILESRDDETVLIVMSDHGFGPLYKYIYLNNWLLEKGYLKLKKNLSTKLKYIIYKSGLTPARALALTARLKLGVPGRLIASAKRARNKGGHNIFRQLLLSADDIDWSATTAYALGGVLAGVYLNIEGREPQGIVSRGHEYEQIRKEIRSDLEKMTDPDTGDRIFSDTFYREEVYSGICLELAPDIVFMTHNDSYQAQGAQDFVFSSNKILDHPRWPPDSGTHRRSGIVLLQGTPFRRDVQLSNARIVDLAPTILYLMGLPIPSDMDGKVLEAAFQEQYLLDNPKSYSEAEVDVEAKSELASPVEDEALIVERLKGLGYLG